MDIHKVVEIAEIPMRHFEACVLKEYDDGYGFITIGWGHLVREGEDFTGGITMEQANELLRQDIRIAITGLTRYIKQEALETLEEHQMAALLCFVFNVGVGNFQASGMRSCINGLDFDGAGREFAKWRRSNGVISAGLVRRRACEALLFATGEIDFYANKSHPEFVY